MAKQKLDYSERIVSFVDLLGFGDEVEVSDFKALPVLARKIESFRQAFHSKSKPTAHYEDEREVFLAFSDGILRAHQPDYSGLFNEIFGFAIGIVQSIHEGHFVRGAITHGAFYYDHKNGILLSPAFVRAFKMEQRDAIAPRVIIDPRTLDALKTNKHWWMHGRYEPDAEVVYKCLRVDNDGYYYIDYIKVLEGNEEFSIFAKFFATHHRMIVEKLSDLKTVGSIRKKYIWLGNYHNRVHADLPDGDGTDYAGWKKSLLVPDKLLLFTDPPKSK